MGLAAVVLLGACLICGAGGEWEGTADFRAISDAAGLVEQSLDLTASLAWELSLAGLDLEVTHSFEELGSDVRAVSEAIGAIEKLKARKVLKEKAELQAKLDAAKAALERGENTQAVALLRHFITQVEALRMAWEFTTKEADPLISDAEAIIRKIDKGKRERRLEIELTATIAQLELAWGLERKEPAFPAPGKDNRDTTLSFAIEADYGQLDLSLELEHQRVDFFQRWSRENSKLVDQVDLDLELDLGDLELSKSLSYKATFFPDQIGDEVELARAALLEQAIQRLKEEIEGSPTIPSEVKSELEGKLQSALDASDQGQRAKVIDYLLGFLDLVERRRREGKIEPAEASWLISEVWSILPRERSRILSGTTAAQFRLSSLDLDLEVEGTGTVKTFPAATKKDEKDTTVALGFEAERGRLSLQGSGTWGRKLFPNDPAKDEVIQAWEWTATFKREQFKAIGSLETETTTFPHSIAKNNIVGTRSVRLEWRLFSAYCTLSWERNGSGYPNAPEKDKLVDELELVVKFAQPGFTIDLQREATAYLLAPSKDKLVRGAEFKLARELAAGLKFELSASFVSQSYPNQPAKEEVTGEMELTITQKF